MIANIPGKKNCGHENLCLSVNSNDEQDGYVFVRSALTLAREAQALASPPAVHNSLVFIQQPFEGSLISVVTFYITKQKYDSVSKGYTLIIMVTGKLISLYCQK